MRSDNDTWDITTSVGSTALFVAAARALEAQKPAPLAVDPYAEVFCRAVGGPWAAVLDGTAPDHPLKAAGFGEAFVNFQAARTRYFDNYFREVAAAGVSQIVMLAAGLDSRAFRLAWPPDMVVYEIDQPEVVAFKSETMAELRVRATCVRRTVAMDLRNDWATALRGAGFDPNKPTAWSAEGLLGYLPPDAQDRLLDTITGLSAPGSWIAIDCAPPSDPAQEQRSRERMRAFSDHWREQGFHLDFSELVYIGERNEASAYLTGHGWRVAATGVNDLLAAHGLAPDGAPLPANGIVSLDGVAIIPGQEISLADLQADKGQELAHEIGGVFVTVDVTKTEQIEDAVNTAMDLGPLRALVNSAGVGWAQRTIGKDGEFESAHSLDLYKKVLDINLVGTFDCIRLAATAMSRSCGNAASSASPIRTLLTMAMVASARRATSSVSRRSSITP